MAFRVAHAGHRCTAHRALAPLLAFVGCRKLGALDGPAVHDACVRSARFDARQPVAVERLKFRQTICCHVV